MLVSFIEWVWSVGVVNPTAGTQLVQKTQKCFQLLDQLRSQVHSRKTKKVEILSLSQEVSHVP